MIFPFVLELDVGLGLQLRVAAAHWLVWSDVEVLFAVVGRV